MMPGLFKSITACDDDLIETMFRVNMDGYYFLCRHLMPLLQRAQAADPAFGVTIVNVSSSSGWMEEPLSPSLGLVGYTMTKVRVKTARVRGGCLQWEACNFGRSSID